MNEWVEAGCVHPCSNSRRCRGREEHAGRKATFPYSSSSFLLLHSITPKLVVKYGSLRAGAITWDTFQNFPEIYLKHIYWVLVTIKNTFFPKDFLSRVSDPWEEHLKEIHGVRDSRVEYSFQNNYIEMETLKGSISIVTTWFLVQIYSSAPPCQT